MSNRLKTTLLREAVAHKPSRRVSFKDEARRTAINRELTVRTRAEPPRTVPALQTLPTLDPADSPLLFTRAISFARFRTAGMKRTLRQGSNERFVTAQRLLTLLQGTRYPRKKLAKPVVPKKPGDSSSGDDDESSEDSSMDSSDEGDTTPYSRHAGRGRKQKKDAGQVSRRHRNRRPKPWGN